jgi:hypothetical protein
MAAPDGHAVFAIYFSCMSRTSVATMLSVLPNIRSADELPRSQLELLERRFALKGKGASPEDLDLYFRGAGVLRRLLESIGLKRVARDVTPLLQDYLAANHPATVTTDEDDGE